MTRRRKMHAAAFLLVILTTAPGLALLCRGHSPSRFATANLPFWERTPPHPVPPRVAMRGLPLLLVDDVPSTARLTQTDPNALFAVLEHPSRQRPSPSGAGRPGLWLLSACALDRPGPALRRQQDVVALRLMNAQHDDGYLAAGVGSNRWSREQTTAYSQNMRGLLAYYADTRGPAALYAALQAGDLVVAQEPVAANRQEAGVLVLPMTLLYQATGEQRYRHWAEQCAGAGIADGPGLCALYAATGRAPYLQAARRVWAREYACHRTDPDLAASLWVLTGRREYRAVLHALTAFNPCPIIPGAFNGVPPPVTLHVFAARLDAPGFSPVPRAPSAPSRGGG